MNVSVLMLLAAENWTSPPIPIVCVCVHPQCFQWVSQVWVICISLLSFAYLASSIQNLLVCRKHSSLQSYVFSGQKEEWSVLLGVGCLEFVAEPEPPLLLELQPAHCLPQGATICTDDTQSRTYREADRRERD